MNSFTAWVFMHFSVPAYSKKKKKSRSSIFAALYTHKFDFKVNVLSIFFPGFPIFSIFTNKYISPNLEYGFANLC